MLLVSFGKGRVRTKVLFPLGRLTPRELRVVMLSWESRRLTAKRPEVWMSEHSTGTLISHPAFVLVAEIPVFTILTDFEACGVPKNKNSQAGIKKSLILSMVSPPFFI
jgi:hypothetical protein